MPRDQGRGTRRGGFIDLDVDVFTSPPIISPLSPSLLLQVNALFHDQFKRWSADYPTVHLVNDGSTCNDDRLGAVACIELVIRECGIDDDLIVVGGYVCVCERT